MPTKQEYSYRNEMDHLRKDMASLSGELDDAESQNLKLKRELNETLLNISTLTGENSRLAKSKNRVQFDFEEALQNLAAERHSVQELSSKVKKLQKDVAVEKNVTKGMEAARDDAVADMEAIEAKVSAAEEKVKAAERRCADMLDEQKAIKTQAHSMLEKKNRAEHMIDEMEGYNQGLERRLEDQKEVAATLSNENKNKDAELRGMDLALSTAKSMQAAEASKAEETIDTLSAQVTKLQRILLQTEGELESSQQRSNNERRLAEKQLAISQVEYNNLQKANGELLTSIQKLKWHRYLPADTENVQYVFV